jgi:hypothetical protein
MNPKNTLYLVLLASALLAYILLFERHRPNLEEREDQARQIFPELNPAEVGRIEIVRSNQVILVERSGGEWQLANPKYPAQSRRIDDWLARVKALTRRTTLTPGEVLNEPAGAAAFGLDPPSAVVVLHQPPARFNFRLGNRTVLGEKTYLQLVGASEVLVTDALVLDGLPKQASDWRSAGFVDLSRLAFNRFAATAESRDFEMEFEPESRRWRMTRPRVARVNEARFVQALQQLQALRVDQFVQDQPGVDLEPYGLDEPALTLEFRSGTNVVFGAQFGQSPTNTPDLVYARRSDYPNVVTVSRQVLDTFGVPYRDFLDYRLVDGSLDEVTRIEIQGAEDFTLQRLTNSTWNVTEPRVFAADPGLVRDFLVRMAGLTVVEVAKEVVTDLDLPNYGLADPSRAYRLSGPGASTNDPAVLRAGLDFGSNRDGLSFVRRTDENPIYTVKTDAVQLLPDASYQFRDRRLWDFETNQVVSLTIHYKDRSVQLLRGESHQWSFAPGSQGIVNTFALEEAVYRMGKLQARAWVDQGADRLALYGIPQLDHWVEVELAEPAAPGRLRVAFGAVSPSGGPFATLELEAEGQPVVFEFPLEIYHVYQDLIESLRPL